MENFVAENMDEFNCKDAIMKGGSGSKLDFVCHDSTTHAYKGEKGRTGFWTNWAVLASESITNGDYVVPSFGSLARGDIVAYYNGTNEFSSNTLAHSQTCTGNGTETWGANNVPVEQGMEWQFATSAAGAMYVHCTNGWPRTIRVFQKP